MSADGPRKLLQRVDNRRARESGPRFTGPTHSGDDDVVIGSPNLIFENRISQGGVPKGISPFLLCLIRFIRFDSACYVLYIILQGE